MIFSLGIIISQPAPLLTFPTTFIHSSHKIIHSIIHLPLPPSSSFTVSSALSTSLYTPLSFLISNSLPLPNSHSWPSVCLPRVPHPISLSVSLSISWLQEMVSFPIQGVGGVYSLSQTKRSLCESSKNTKKKRKTDKNQKPTLIRLSQTRAHTHFTSVELTQNISVTFFCLFVLLFLHCRFGSKVSSNSVSTGLGLDSRVKVYSPVQTYSTNNGT